MNFIRYTVKFLLFLLPVSLAAQNPSASELTAPLSGKEKACAGDALPGERDKWIENENERTVYSRSFTVPDGRVVIQYSSVPVCYRNAAGKLVPIDPVIHVNADGKGWTAQAQPYPTYLHEDGSAAVSLFNDSRFVFGQNCSVNGKQANLTARLAVEGSLVTMRDVIPGIDKQMEYRANGVKYSYLIRQPQQAAGDFSEFAEELDIPEGYSLIKDETQGRTENGGWTGDYLLRSTAGEIAAQIKAPVCFDAERNWTIGTYVLANENGNTVLKIRVPNSWLNDPSRTYPVTIDPTITGPTAFWTGGTMPSCIAPAYNTDSIQVTIPGQISVTGLIVTASFYADPFTTATMSMGAMWFSTNCSQTQQFTISGSAGNSPGTAYLDTFNMRSPLLCCYPQNCQQQTFYLRMHLNRTGPGSGCNTTYIRYDPSTTLWPFMAYVVGHTVETFGQGFTVQSAPVCSNVCNFTGTLYIRYGVPPFTISHPWLQNNIVVGTPVGCSLATTIQALNFTNPNCPVYCNSNTSLTVQPPNVVDACGNSVSGLVSRTLTIKPTPQLTASPNGDSICPGEAYTINLSSCLAGSTVAWAGNNTSGSGPISGTGMNSSSSDTTVYFAASASLNGCSSDTIVVPLVVDPAPNAAFTWTQPAISGVPVNFTDQSSSGSGTFVNWLWDFGDSNGSSQQNPSNVYGSPGTYTVCLQSATNHGCIDTVCNLVEVIPAEVEAPNVFTPNGDGVNDFLAFRFLEFYPNNRVDIYDRWGARVLGKNGYANDWNATGVSDGTYYYVLSLPDKGKVYTGFVELIR